MAIIKDPQGNELTTLGALVDFENRRVLEVGCGDGRLTWRYAGEAAQVTAIDPDSEAIERARVECRGELEERVVFLATTIEDFGISYKGDRFDIAIYAWSL